LHFEHEHDKKEQSVCGSKRGAEERTSGKCTFFRVTILACV